MPNQFLLALCSVPFSVDGADVVDQLVEIPLPGRTFISSAVETPGDSASVTLPSFVAGPENRLVAVAVNRALVASQTAESLSEVSAWRTGPLVLWGPSGSGKSHLAHGLIRRVKRQLGDDQADYFTATEFRQEFGEAIGADTVDQFRQRVRSLAVLALDDLHRMPDDPYLQEELIHTLDALEERGSLVIVTANRPIRSLRNIWPAVANRLAGGLVLRLELPGKEARQRLVERVARMIGLQLPGDVAERFAEDVAGSANRLFGELFELRHRRELGGQIDLDMLAKQWPRRAASSRPELRDVIRTVARYYGLTQKVLKSASRKRSVVQARAVAIYLAREMGRYSYQRIADALGGRDHTTIMHSYRRIEREASCNPAMQDALGDLKLRLTGGVA